LRRPEPQNRHWYIDEIVVAAFSFLGFGGAVFLPLKFGFDNVPPIVVSFLLATGLAALTYKYLGGIEGASFAVGALKLGGTLAALVGIALLINSQLMKQISHNQIWYVSGRVLDDQKHPVNELNDADFTVFPGAGHAEQLGDFRVEFIRDNSQGGLQHVYLSVNHRGYGQVTIPLDVGELKSLYPDVRVEGQLINLDHITLPQGNGAEAPYSKDGPPPQALQPAQVPAYNAVAESAKPANSGGLPQ
jgi:hypothetical protein